MAESDSVVHVVTYGRFSVLQTYTRHPSTTGWLVVVARRCHAPAVTGSCPSPVIAVVINPRRVVVLARAACCVTLLHFNPCRH